MNRLSLSIALLFASWLSQVAVAEDPLFWIFDINEQSVKNNASEPDGSSNSPGSGFGTVTLDRETNVLSYDFAWADLIGNLTKLHIHGPASANESNPQHIVEIFGPPEVPAELATNAGRVADSFELQTLEQAGFDPIDPAYIIDTLVSGQAYLNVHTTVFGMGEIRGNLGLPVSRSIPEPNACVLLPMGLAWLAAMRRR